MRIDMHFHAKPGPERGRWACGAAFGPASGDIRQVDCPSCMKTDAFQAEVQADSKREEEYLARMLGHPVTPKEVSHNATAEVVPMHQAAVPSEGAGKIPEHAAS